ncbi:MAG: hypothetical protein QXM68_03680 [Candidatus Aenigmatarchaeota archaeon]|nr:hypothetical protein [Candidatus Aenigmarchaeota archaeon]
MYYCENDGIYNPRSPECTNCKYRRSCKNQLNEESGKRVPYGMHYVDTIEQAVLSRKPKIPGVQNLSNHQ